ncbi:MAG: bifunctional DNA-formamidopyrimidine glycosylase/DNA-(apurinic or apyrimidinic site) lyase [Rhodospirillaceae bacterium]|nr:bifunctional DNA-formamidopyrimidine glycosylase/DNA-(apurinic or apyrimidinic site) lyase [Rhodospirillaceae bacterium]MYF87019.1 bifunctional DNA-formamidopyrimidine glycosylase/DNA-(apurinic or apyrimidinic site) lyase [Rhodospirillaceae bacterium]MYH37821.1 bifunctional DNA-formamidopyrimidine glycosylase/DNA-(apurinic or apyrimidinic site) lyase [Rhodospirillaceae bacterium]MYK12968.1 bifunctional DNA-formamidopyrimidine glycosylase/DNA-(apurinic or apyrimidinic site) lyase [Rhodospirill
MPELPEVETVVRGLRPVLEGAVLVRAEARRPDLRIPVPADFSERLTGRTVRSVRRRAKYILAELDDGALLILHLGMSGRLYIDRGDPDLLAHDHIVLKTDRGDTIRLNDPRRFGLVALDRVDTIDRHRLFAGAGPEPLGNAFNGPALAAKLKGRRTPLKAALLDQKTVAGLGNIYVCEALFLAGLSPARLARTVSARQAEALAGAIKDVLSRAIAAGGSSLRDYVQPSGELGYFQHQWAVYGKEGEACPGCDCAVAETGGIRRIVQSNRSTFYCPHRQR